MQNDAVKLILQSCSQEGRLANASVTYQLAVWTFHFGHDVRNIVQKVLKILYLLSAKIRGQVKK